MSAYFDHPFLSNSDLKKFQSSLGLKRQMPDNMEAIFAFGSNFHACILEPHLVNREHEDIDLAMAMRATFWADKLCRDFAMGSDFVQEKEYYEKTIVGPYEVDLRCKMDGARPVMKCMLELKGLSIETEKAFNNSLYELDYDQAIAHYLLTSRFNMALIVGISKRNPKKLFKKIVKKHDEFYLEGEHKLIESLELLRAYAPSDVKLLA